MDKIGFIYTIGLLFMALTVLSLALFIVDTGKGSERNVADLVKYERLYNLDSSINEAFVEIFKVAGNISINYSNKTNNTLFIKERLPNNRHVAFGYNMTTFRKFLNKSISTSSENITIYNRHMDTVNLTLPLIITPYNITYEHLPAFGGNQIRISPRTFNFYGYNITILSSADILTTSAWAPALSSGSSNDMIFKVRIKGPSAGNQIITNARIQSTTISTLTVRNLANTQDLFRISLDNAKVTIENLQPATNTIIVTSGIMMIGNQREITKIMYPKKLYNITFDELNIKKSSSVTLLTLPV